LVARETDGYPTSPAGILGGAARAVVGVASTFKVAELGLELPSFHSMASVGKVGSTGLHPDGQLFLVVLEVPEHHLFAAVSYDLGVHCPVG
jgi:hypothetical protein